MEEEKVKDWIIAVSKLKSAKESELALRLEICEHILQGQPRGSAKMKVGKFHLKAHAKVNAKIDKDVLRGMWKTLLPAEKKCIKMKPDLVSKELKTLDVESQLFKAITEKPGTPTLEVK